MGDYKVVSRTDRTQWLAAGINGSWRCIDLDWLIKFARQLISSNWFKYFHFSSVLMN